MHAPSHRRSGKVYVWRCAKEFRRLELASLKEEIVIGEDTRSPGAADDFGSFLYRRGSAAFTPDHLPMGMWHLRARACSDHWTSLPFINIEINRSILFREQLKSNSLNRKKYDSFETFVPERNVNHINNLVRRSIWLYLSRHKFLIRWICLRAGDINLSF